MMVTFHRFIGTNISYFSFACPIIFKCPHLSSCKKPANPFWDLMYVFATKCVSCINWQHCIWSKSASQDWMASHLKNFREKCLLALLVKMCQFTPQMINSIVLKSAHCLSNAHTWKDFLKKLVYNVSNLFFKEFLSFGQFWNGESTIALVFCSTMPFWKWTWNRKAISLDKGPLSQNIATIYHHNWNTVQLILSTERTAK